MKQTYILLNNLQTIIIIITVSLLFMNGCNDDDNGTDPGTGGTVPSNIFPLVTGHTIVYGQGTLLLLASTTPIAGTEAGFNSTWTIAGQTPSSIQLPAPHPSATIVLDVTSVPAAGVNNAQRQFFIFQDTTTGNFDFLTNLGFLFRSQKIYRTPGDSASGFRADSLVWIQLARPSEGLNKEWTTYSANYTSATLGAIRFEIVAQFTEKTKLTVAGTEYDIYKLLATRKVYLGTSTVAASTGKTAEIWLAPGIGPVYIELIGDDESHGKRQTMTSKNF